MTSYPLDVRMEVVLYVLQEKNSIRDAARKYSIGKSVIHRWLQRYKENGTDGLFSTQGHYPTDYKISVLSYMYTQKFNYIETSKYFSIPNSGTVQRWDQVYLQEGIAGFYKKKGRLVKKMTKKPDQSKKTQKIGKPRIPLTREDELLVENERLRMENAYLKKLNALVQERERSEKKTK